MTRDELLRLFDSGDLYGLMLLAVRAWLAKDHPEVNEVTVVGERAAGLSSVQVPIRPTTSASSSRAE